MTTITVPIRRRWCSFTGRFILEALLPACCGPAAGPLYMGQTAQEATDSAAQLNARRAALGLPTFTLDYSRA
jgi:hypothetical protein